MCSVKTPQVQQTPEKPPIIITNPQLDGLDPKSQALRRGRSSLRIEPRTPGAAGTTSSGPISDVAGVRVGSAVPAPSAASAAGGSRSGWGSVGRVYV